MNEYFIIKRGTFGLGLFHLTKDMKAFIHNVHNKVVHNGYVELDILYKLPPPNAGNKQHGQTTTLFRNHDQSAVGCQSPVTQPHIGRNSSRINSIFFCQPNGSKITRLVEEKRIHTRWRSIMMEDTHRQYTSLMRMVSFLTRR